MSEKKVYDITLDFAEIYGVNSEYTDNIGGEVYYPYDRYSKFPPNNFPENITPVQKNLPLPDNIAENHYYHTYDRYSTNLQNTFQENVAPPQESSTLPDSVKADHYFPYDRFPTVPQKSFKDDVQEQSTSKRADNSVPVDHYYPFERYSKAPQNNFPENITPEQDITTAPIEDEDTEYNNKCSALALSILEDGDPDDFYPSCGGWDLNEMDKNPPTGPPRRISNRPTLKNLNPVFHRRDKSEDNNELSQTLLKQARKSGSLNLSGRGLATVPEKVYDINQSDKDAEVTLESLVAKEEDAWWNQVPLSNLDLSSNSLTSLSPKIANLYSLTTLILHDNCLSSLPKEIGKLEKLTRVNLSRNQLVELPTEFYTLPNLRYLNLSHNNIEELHPDISDLHMLEILDVSNNQLTLLPNGIGFLVRLTQLLLSYNHIKELPEDLVNMRSLQKLDLLHNDLIQLPDDIGSLRKLQCLYLQHNDIVALPDFEGCEDLQELHVANNFISSLPADLCSKLPHLKILDLRDNKIVKLPDEIALLQSLIRLDLSNNSITSLPCSLSTLAHLVSLQVEGNPIKSIRRDILQCGTARILKTLRDRFLSAEGNCSTSTSTTTLTSTAMGGDGLNMPSRPMPQGGFIGDETSVYPDKFKLRKTHCLTVTLQNLTEVPDYVFEVANDENANIVDFSKNRLTTLPPGLQIMRNCASELIFANNLISSIPPFISQFTRISLIDISCNSLEDLPKEFGVLNTLRELNISNNRFQQLPQCVYDLQNLEVLMARDNRIRRIDTTEQGLGALKRLATLNLRNNNIEQVPPTLGNLKNITTLDIVGNPFRQPRHQVLEKGTEAIMSYLRDRIPV